MTTVESSNRADRSTFVWITLALVSLGHSPALSQAIRPLAQEYVVVYQSPDPARIYCYTPGIVRLEGGRLVVTMDRGGPGLKSGEPRGKLFTSDVGRRRTCPSPDASQGRLGSDPPGELDLR